MRKLILIAMLGSLFPGWIFTQNLIRYGLEKEDFAQLALGIDPESPDEPTKWLEHAVIEYAWGNPSQDKKIVALYQDRAIMENGLTQVNGIVLFHLGGGEYEKVDFPIGMVGNGHPWDDSEWTMAVLFEDVDKDGDKEMVILHGSYAKVWVEELDQYASGEDYLTFVFKQKKGEEGYENELIFLEEVSQKLDGCADAATVRKLIKELK
ncbi:MAG: hypothetical protein H6581_01340 [Bacteroidia bacterium]|nr:hypothetical protein [Bacteroidia bacterium]